MDDGVLDGLSIHLVLRLPRHPRTIAFVRDFARDALVLVATPDDVINDICVAVSEACANAVEHASGVDDYEVTLDVNADRFTAMVTDQGQGLDEKMVSAPMPAPGESRGRGVPLMRALTDDATFTVQPGIGTTVQLIKLLAPAEPAEPQA
jgi:serine/threonine-protein kinase RsbW